MDSQVVQQIAIGVLLLSAGFAGWLLPSGVQWLRRDSGSANSVPHRRGAPVFLGALIAVMGLGILLGTAVYGRFGLEKDVVGRDRVVTIDFKNVR